MLLSGDGFLVRTKLFLRRSGLAAFCLFVCFCMILLLRIFIIAFITITKTPVGEDVFFSKHRNSRKPEEGNGIFLYANVESIELPPNLQLFRFWSRFREVPHPIT